MRKAFIQALLQLAKEDPSIYLLTPDIGYSVLEPFQAAFPDRFFNTGITEQATIGIAAGLALRGKTPFVYTIIPFVTMRPFEQVRLDIAYQDLPVRLVGVGAGYSYGAAGGTHHAIEDIALMRALPNMTVLCPGDPWEVSSLVRQSQTHRHPIYFRLGKNGEPLLHVDRPCLQIGKGVYLREGEDGILLSTSNMLEQALNWAQKSAERGLQLSVVSLHTVKPLDEELLASLAKKGAPIATLEEHSLIGGLGSAVAEWVAEKGRGIPFQRFGIQDQFCHCVGSHEYLKKEMNLQNFPKVFEFFAQCRSYA